MNQVKINLIMDIPGITMISESESSPKNMEKFEVDLSQNPSKRFYKTVLIRGTKKAQKILNVSLSAYRYFTSKEMPYGFNAPEGYSPKSFWFKMTKKERLEWHLHNLCKSMNGKLVSYKVYDTI